MPRAKAFHCFRRISQGEPRAPLPLRNAEWGFSLTSSLTQPSPQGEGFHIRLPIENPRGWICRTVIRQTRNARQLFPLLGERIKGEGGRQNKIHSVGRRCGTWNVLRIQPGIKMPGYCHHVAVRHRVSNRSQRCPRSPLSNF